MRVVEKWQKVHNNKIMEIEIIFVDWGYQAYCKNRSITKMEVNLQDLQNILFGNGCEQILQNNNLVTKKVNILQWQVINWDTVANWEL